MADFEAAAAVSTEHAACTSSIDERDEAVLAAGLSASRMSADIAEAREAIDAVKAVAVGARAQRILTSGRIRAEQPLTGGTPAGPGFTKVRANKIVRITSPPVTATTAAKVLTAAAAASAAVGMDCASVPFGPAMDGGRRALALLGCLPWTYVPRA